jgi:hypothetical protein
MCKGLVYAFGEEVKDTGALDDPAGGKRRSSLHRALITFL